MNISKPAVWFSLLALGACAQQPTQPQAESAVQPEQPAAAAPAPAPKPRVVVRPQVKPPTLPVQAMSQTVLFKLLLAEGAEVRGWDPVADGQALPRGVEIVYCLLAAGSSIARDRIKST